MKANKAALILESIASILKHYENQNLEDALKDIQSKLSGSDVVPMHSSEKTATNNSEDFSGVLSDLQKLSNEEKKRYLSQFKKADLMKIAASVEIKLQTKDKKETMIQYIVNHFGFMELHQQMGNRYHLSGTE
ncbi:MAG: hypothetical protein ACO1OC_13325 [Tuberibacillus sp.]